MTAKGKKLLMAGLAAVVLLPVVCFLLYGVLMYGVLGAQARVCVGKGGMGRTMELQRLAVFEPEEVYSAVALLDDYYPVEAVQTLADDYGLQVKNVFLWTRGETGRAMFPVEDSRDIATAVGRNVQRSLDDPDTSPEERRDMERAADGEMGVFALVIEGKAAELNRLRRKVPQFSAVDVEFNAVSELQGKIWGKTVSYVYLPVKPDGAN